MSRPQPPTTPHPDDSRCISDAGMSLQEQLDSQKKRPSLLDDEEDVVSTFSDLSSRFRSEPRSDSEINISQPVIKQGDRPVLSKDLQKLRELASS